ncbi:thioredoxin domain-containing protein [Candidatus Saccharibacteria bacterium]|nr:thioredoxin domain-containing protein [Candidatus Saccharibacteria bacterium]
MERGIRIGVLIIVCGAFLALMFFNIMNKPPVSSKVWDEGTTIGDPDTATRHYVQYADLGCPYCDVFSRLTVQNEEDFKNYLAENHILFEIRLTDTIYESAGIDFSRDSAIAAYCAKREGKFIDYYHAGVMALYDDYQSKGIGDSKTSPMITDMPKDYWLEIGHEIGLSENFDSCVKNKETLDEVNENTIKASQYISGLPYFQFEEFKQSGFDNNWDYKYVIKYLDAGLGKK